MLDAMKWKVYVGVLRELRERRHCRGGGRSVMVENRERMRDSEVSKSGGKAFCEDKEILGSKLKRHLA